MGISCTRTMVCNDGFGASAAGHAHAPLRPHSTRYSLGTHQLVVSHAESVAGWMLILSSGGLCSKAIGGGCLCDTVAAI